MLQLRDVKKDYLVDKVPYPALKGITLTFSSLQFVSVLGPSGCGKTTLLNLIGGLDSLTSGRILFQGQEVSKRKEKELDSYRNNHIGFIFQDYYLVPNLTVFENVKLALSVRDYSEADRKKRVLEALKKVDIEKLASKKPSQLSGGQAQRVAIARAIVTNPSILLADEPTGALDSENSKKIRQLLKDLSKEHLVIRVTHNEDLARVYSDRLIHRKDGLITKDESLKESPVSFKEKKELRKSSLSLLRKLKLAVHNLFSRKWKTILAAVANSFGRIGIAFFLAINHGFTVYSNSLSVASATSLPVVVSSYDQINQKEQYGDKNQSIAYPDSKEIYPALDTESSYGYTRNQFTPKYLSYLDQRKEEGILSDYSINYGNDYNFNLTTEYPKSLNGSKEGGLREVDTSKTSYNYYAYSAGLPWNIFHSLYGDLNQYDLICGNRPESENDLVLVVSTYNAVNFSILQGLGFYNPADTSMDVSDLSLKTKVKPISFSDVIGKTYRIFDNDDYFFQNDSYIRKDADGNNRSISSFSKHELTKAFYESGRELKITGILRPKQGSNRSRLAPSLCFLPKLQEELVSKNKTSKVSLGIKNNLVFTRPDDLDRSVSARQGFLKERNDLADEFRDSKSDVLPTDKLNKIATRYLNYYPFVTSNYRYLGTGRFLSDGKKIGADLILDEVKNLDLTDSSSLNDRRTSIAKDYRKDDIDSCYSKIISLIAYVNAYSEIQDVVLFPTDLSKREILLQRLDSFNEIVEGSLEHASNKNEQVYYHKSDASGRITDVAERISLVSTILLIFACVSLIVSSARTGLLTSNNVLERRKEIGLLRSLGSKKRDVAAIFEMESLFTGRLAGIFGSLLTYCLSFPINALMNHYYSFYAVGHICSFTWYHSLIVIAFSVLLGRISALVPAIKAGKEDPVKALKNE